MHLEKPRFIIPALAFAAISILLFAQFAVAISSTNVSNINQWTTIDNCSYIVFTDGTTYYSKSGETGAIGFSGTAAHTVIRNTELALTSGGKICVKAGTYTLTASVKPVSNVIIQGEGIGNTIFSVSGNVGAFVKNDGTAMSNFALMDMTIDGNGSTENLINFASNAANFDIIRVEVKDAADFLAFQVGDVRDSIFDTNTGGFDMVAGIYTGSEIVGNTFKNGGAQGLTTGDGQNITISHNFFTNIATKAISLESIDNPIRNILIANNVFKNSGSTDIQLHRTTHAIGNMTIVGNIAKSIVLGTNGQSHGNVVTGNKLASIQVNGFYNIVSNNQFNGSGNTSEGAVILWENTGWNRIIGNTVMNSKGAGIWLRDSDNNVVQGNLLINNGQNTNNTSDAIHIVNFGGATPDNNIIQGNTVIPSASGNKVRYGINHASGSNNIIADNQLVGTFATAAMNLAGGGASTAFVHHNKGFVTEARNTGAISSGNTNANVTHGLSYTPSATDCTVEWRENPDTDPTVMWLSDFTSTQFRINIPASPGASGLDFAWQCRRN